MRTLIIPPIEARIGYKYDPVHDDSIWMIMHTFFDTAKDYTIALPLPTQLFDFKILDYFKLFGFSFTHMPYGNTLSSTKYDPYPLALAYEKIRNRYDYLITGIPLGDSISNYDYMLNHSTQPGIKQDCDYFFLKDMEQCVMANQVHLTSDAQRYPLILEGVSEMRIRIGTFTNINYQVVDAQGFRPIGWDNEHLLVENEKNNQFRLNRYVSNLDQVNWLCRERVILADFGQPSVYSHKREQALMLGARPVYDDIGAYI